MGNTPPNVELGQSQTPTCNFMHNRCSQNSNSHNSFQTENYNSLDSQQTSSYRDHNLPQYFYVNNSKNRASKKRFPQKNEPRPSDDHQPRSEHPVKSQILHDNTYAKYESPPKSQIYNESPSHRPETIYEHYRLKFSEIPRNYNMSRKENISVGKPESRTDFNYFKMYAEPQPLRHSKNKKAEERVESEKKGAAKLFTFEDDLIGVSPRRDEHIGTYCSPDRDDHGHNFYNSPYGEKEYRYGESPSLYKVHVEAKLIPEQPKRSEHQYLKDQNLFKEGSKILFEPKNLFESKTLFEPKHTHLETNIKFTETKYSEQDDSQSQNPSNHLLDPKSHEYKNSTLKQSVKSEHDPITRGEPITYSDAPQQIKFAQTQVYSPPLNSTASEYHYAQMQNSSGPSSYHFYGELKSDSKDLKSSDHQNHQLLRDSFGPIDGSVIEEPNINLNKPKEIEFHSGQSFDSFGPKKYTLKEDSISDPKLKYSDNYSPNQNNSPGLNHDQIKIDSNQILVSEYLLTEDGKFDSFRRNFESQEHKDSTVYDFSHPEKKFHVPFAYDTASIHQSVILQENDQRHEGAKKRVLPNPFLKKSIDNAGQSKEAKVDTPRCLYLSKGRMTPKSSESSVFVFKPMSEQVYEQQLQIAQTKNADEVNLVNKEKSFSFGEKDSQYRAPTAQTYPEIRVSNASKPDIFASEILNSQQSQNDHYSITESNKLKDSSRLSPEKKEKAPFKLPPLFKTENFSSELSLADPEDFNRKLTRLLQKASAIITEAEEQYLKSKGQHPNLDEIIEESEEKSEDIHIKSDQKSEETIKSEKILANVLELLKKSEEGGSKPGSSSIDDINLYLGMREVVSIPVKQPKILRSNTNLSIAQKNWDFPYTRSVSLYQSDSNESIIIKEDLMKELANSRKSETHTPPPVRSSESPQKIAQKELSMNDLPPSVFEENNDKLIMDPNSMKNEESKEQQEFADSSNGKNSKSLDISSNNNTLIESKNEESKEQQEFADSSNEKNSKSMDISSNNNALIESKIERAQCEIGSQSEILNSEEKSRDNPIILSYDSDIFKIVGMDEKNQEKVKKTTRISCPGRNSIKVFRDSNVASIETDKINEEFEIQNKPKSRSEYAMKITRESMDSMNSSDVSRIPHIEHRSTRRISFDESKMIVYEEANLSALVIQNESLSEIEEENRPKVSFLLSAPEKKRRSYFAKLRDLKKKNKRFKTDVRDRGIETDGSEVEKKAQKGEKWRFFEPGRRKRRNIYTGIRKERLNRRGLIPKKKEECEIFSPVVRKRKGYFSRLKGQKREKTREKDFDFREKERREPEEKEPQKKKNYFSLLKEKRQKNKISEKKQEGQIEIERENKDKWEQFSPTLRKKKKQEKFKVFKEERNNKKKNEWNFSDYNDENEAEPQENGSLIEEGFEKREFMEVSRVSLQEVVEFKREESGNHSKVEIPNFVEESLEKREIIEESQKSREGSLDLGQNGELEEQSTNKALDKSQKSRVSLQDAVEFKIEEFGNHSIKSRDSLQEAVEFKKEESGNDGRKEVEIPELKEENEEEKAQFAGKQEDPIEYWDFPEYIEEELDRKSVSSSIKSLQKFENILFSQIKEEKGFEAGKLISLKNAPSMMAKPSILVITSNTSQKTENPQNIEGKQEKSQKKPKFSRLGKYADIALNLEENLFLKKQPPPTPRAKDKFPRLGKFARVAEALERLFSNRAPRRSSSQSSAGSENNGNKVSGKKRISFEDFLKEKSEELEKMESPVAMVHINLDSPVGLPKRRKKQKKENYEFVV